jgi:hypothetical protein
VIAIPPAVLKPVQRWVAQHALTIVPLETEKVPMADEHPAYHAIAFLVSKGCAAEDVVDLLELLHSYGSTAAFKRNKKNWKEWTNQAKKLVLRLREVAEDTEQFEKKHFPDASTKPATKPWETPAAAPARVPTDDSDAIEEISADELAPSNSDLFDQPEVWDVMREKAYDVGAYIRMLEDPDMALAEIYTRKWGETLPFLVMAAALVEATTGSPHYGQLATLLEQICPKPMPKPKRKPKKPREPKPREPWSGQAVEKKVNRFKERYPGFVLEYLTSNPKEKSVEPERVRATIKQLLQ